MSDVIIIVNSDDKKPEGYLDAVESRKKQIAKLKAKSYEEGYKQALNDIYEKYVKKMRVYNLQGNALVALKEIIEGVQL